MGCAKVIVLDTHVLVWSQFEQKQLGKKSVAMLERRWSRGEVAIPAIAFWEVGLLIERGRLNLKISLKEWRQQLIDAGVIEFPLTSEIAIRALDFSGLHPDPADRFIAATAIIHGATLMTADEKLLSWHHPLERYDATK
jgi:PIN domain nuclease of toxin-antitoxin system